MADNCRLLEYRREPARNIGLLRFRCLIMLGEPGIGKSWTVKNIAQPTIEITGETLFLTLDLVECSNESSLIELLQSETIRTWRESDQSTLCLTLDSLDDVCSRIRAAPLILRNKLREWNTHQRLILRVVCRSAEWPTILEEALRDAFPGEYGYGAFNLLPLKRGDVAEFASAQTANPDAFLESIEAAGAVPLASRPLTLKMLLQIYSGSTSLPPRAAELYEKGLHILCEETYL